MHETSFHLKDKNPPDTVRLIKSILKNLDIETEEKWNEISEAGTYSLRLVIKDTSIGTNGKGTSKFLAMASAYGEFIERLQNDILIEIDSVSTKSDSNAEYICLKDEKIFTADELIKQKSKFIDCFLRSNKKGSLSEIEQAKWFNKVCGCKLTKTRIKDKYVCAPFINTKTGKDEYLPTFLVRLALGSNGMSAGNTKEEALVEGISELIERWVQQRVILEGLCLPDIPVSFIKKYQSVYKMFEKLNKFKNYKVILKDASLGGIWPAVALICINKNSGEFGVNFGAHPNVNIAMERVFTEAFQGTLLESFTKKSNLCFDDKITKSYISVSRNRHNCCGNYPADFFSSSSDFEFKLKNCGKKSNKGFYKYLINLLEKNGMTVLIREKSHFGFPSFHAIIPEFIQENSFDYKNIMNCDDILFAKKHLLDVRTVNKNNAQRLIKALSYYLWCDQRSKLKEYIPECTKDFVIPCGKSKCGTYYLISMLYVMKGDYNNALNMFMRVFNYKDIQKLCDKNTMPKILITKYYLEARSNGFSHKDTVDILHKFFDLKHCDYADVLFSNPNEVLNKQYYIINDMLDSEVFYPQRKLEELYSIINNYKLNYENNSHEASN